MSRLIIKNLPPYITPSRLSEHFTQTGSPSGTLTDIKVASKPDGTSRQFGFVGYKTEEEALKAKEWFDKTFVDSTRIRVDIIQGSKDAPIPRPNKRLRVDSENVGTTDEWLSKKKTKTKGTETQAKGAPESTASAKKSKKDSQMEEFLEVMKTRKGPSWANEPQPKASTSATKLDDTEFEADTTTKDGLVNEEGISDMEWMRKRMTEKSEAEIGVEKVFFQSDDEEDATSANQPHKPEAEGPESDEKDHDHETKDAEDPVKQTILQTSRLFVRNLAFSCSEKELEELFGKFGEISQVHIPLDPSTHQSKGLAYITFAKAADAVTAYETLDKTSFQGRLLHILAAVDRRGPGTFQVEEGVKRSVKDEKNAKRKVMAGKEFNWSMLYMNSDAVASSIADRMNISKSDILNPDDPSSSTNPAVKLALAETHIINETKEYLETNGVVLSSFSSPSTRTIRSQTTLLVKNIPYGTTASQIRELFEPHGTLSRVLVPPAGTIAVVDFENAHEADRAFRSVVYRRLGNSVVYLERAPVGVFREGGAGEEGEMTRTLMKESPGGGIPAYAVKIPEQESESPKAGDGDGEGDTPALSAGTTLFVKNLSFSTTTERLNQMFRNLPSFAFARVQMKPDPNPKKTGGQLSMGYGFIGFKDIEGAKKAMKSIQGFVLDGHALHVKFAGRGKEEEGDDDKKAQGVGSKSRTTKMIVKNVPFEATKKDIRDLFGSHGTLKSVRLPKKFDSRTRGFAFLDFISRQEAENAYSALRHTHLLGRHLVLEWAEEQEQDLDALRRKAGVGLGVGPGGGTGKRMEMPGKKKKLDMGVVGEGEGDDD